MTQVKNREVRMESLGTDELRQVYRQMLLTRIVDEKMLIMLKQGKSFFHIGCAGHEAIQIAMAMHMQPGKDYAYPYYRDLAFVLQYGVTVEEIFLNFLARAADPSSGGRQMPNHYGHKKLRIVSQSSPTGTQFLQAVGTALAIQRKNGEEIVYVSSGEGTTSQGDFHEAINWAAREDLPVIFVIQNNKYAISVRVEEQLAGGSVYRLTAGYENLRRFKVDGTDFIRSFEVAEQAVRSVREGGGPVLVEAETVRLLPHSSSDAHHKYRPVAELEREKLKDPLFRLRKQLLDAKIFAEEELRLLREEVKAEVDRAAEKAEKYARPDPESLNRFLYAPGNPMQQTESQGNGKTGKSVVMVDAINHTLKEEMARDERIYVFGEDVADNKGGVFGATSGLSSQFGRARCFNSPLAESSIIGVAIGMALTGLKPVVEIQFGDYIWTAMMQIRNELATMRWRSNNSWSAAVVVRVPVGGYIHGGPYHSQNIEGFFAHLPGIYIVYPSNAADAKGLLKTAIRGEDPVLFLEHKGLYRQSYAASPEPDEDYLLPFGRAAIKHQGEDLTLVTYGAVLYKALEASRKLEKEGFSVEIIDLRTIKPLDMESVLKSVRKTGKVLVVHEDSMFHGFGAEIAARIAEAGFEYLDAPVRRLAAKDVPVPFSDVLERATLPQSEDIYVAARELIRY